MRNKNLIIAGLLSFVVVVQGVLFFNLIAEQSTLQKNSSAVHKLIVDLEQEIGYGGLIHNFKNALLRPENKTYIVKAFKNYDTSITLIEQIESRLVYFVKNPELKQIKVMLKAYQERLIDLPTYFQKNLNARQIDDIVVFDDRKAYSEIVFFVDEVFQSFEAKSKKLFYRNLILSLLMITMMVGALVFYVRYVLIEQKKLIETTKNINTELKQYKKDLLKSQKAMFNVIEDLKAETAMASALNLKLENKSRENQQFVYTVSHDLKSPLVTIGAFARKLKQEVSLTDKQSHWLKRVIENAEHMSCLLKDLLCLSRMANVEIHKKLLNVQEVFQKQLNALEKQVQESKAEIVINQTLHYIKANETMFAQCLYNLVNNAIAYKDPARNLVIEIATEETADAIIVIFKDNGIGIDKKYHEQVFRLFQSLNSDTGTGVGLTIVKTVIKRHNGFIELDSEVGKGSTFRLAFPK